MGEEQLPEGEVESVKKRIVNWVFSFYVTTALLILIFIVALSKEGAIAASALDGSFGLLSVIVFTFLGVNTLDRSNILGKIGDGVKNSGTKIKVLTPAEMRDIAAKSGAEPAPVTQVNINPAPQEKSDG